MQKWNNRNNKITHVHTHTHSPLCLDIHVNWIGFIEIEENLRHWRT